MEVGDLVTILPLLSIFSSLGMSFVFKDYIADLIATIVIKKTRDIKIGNRIKISSGGAVTKGDIMDIGLIRTTIMEVGDGERLPSVRTGRLIKVPNYMLISNPVMIYGDTIIDEVTAYEHGAQKFQAGTPDVAGPVGLAAAVGFFKAAGPLLQRHDDELVRHGLAKLAAIPRLRIIGPRSAENRVPVFTFVIEGQQATAVARALDARGIAVRAGDMAALPLLRRFGTSEAVRASAYVYSTPDDLDRLADALGGLGK